MKKNVNQDYIYIPEDPLDMLKNFEEKEDFREVLYTFGNEEIVKENGKYYLSHTMYPSQNKEISRETATEMWQSFNMKSRGDVSVNFDFDHTKYNFF